MKKFEKAVSLLVFTSVAFLGSCGRGGVTNRTSGKTSAKEETKEKFYVVYDGKTYTSGAALEVNKGAGIALLDAQTESGDAASFEFESDNPDIVSVDTYTGYLTPKAVGSANVTVKQTKFPDNKMTFAITVKDTALATKGQSYISASFDEKAKILGTLEKYAVDNYLTGITLFSNGSRIAYNDRYQPLPTEYVSGYGWGTTREGSFKEPLKNPEVEKPTYYNVGAASLPAHANAMNASGSDISTVYGYISNSFWETRLSLDKTKAEWYPKLANDERPIAIDDNGNVISSDKPEYNNNRRWRVHVKTGANTNGAFVYRTASTAKKNDVSISSFNNRQVVLEDYLTPLRLMLTNWNGQYRGAELTEGVSGFTGAKGYFNNTSTQPSEYALYNKTLWNQYMGDEKGFLCDASGKETSTRGNIITGKDEGGDYIEFNLLLPCSRFYAMYYLSSALYSPLPEDFITLWGPSDLGKSPDGYTPLDTMLSSGPYYIETWDTLGTKIDFKKNDEYFYKVDQDGAFKNNPRNVYNIDGISYRQIASTETKNNFLAGKTDSYAPTKDDLTKEFINMSGKGTNMSWTAYQTKGDSNFKLNVNSMTKQQWVERFGRNGSVEPQANDAIATNGDGTWSGIKTYMSNIHFLNFLSFALDRETICASRGMTPTQEYFSDNYQIDPEKGITYNSTEAHKAVLADRYNDTYGHNDDAAKAELRQVFNDVLPALEKTELKATSGNGEPGSATNPYIVPIDMFWMNTTDQEDYKDVFSNIENIFTQVASERAYRGRYQLQINMPTPSTDYNEVYKRMERGNYDIGFGAVSGNDLNPLNFIEVLKSDNSSGFTLNWGPDTSEVSDDIVYDGKKWSFDGLWYAANTGVVLNDKGTVARAINASATSSDRYGYKSIDKTARSITYTISFDDLIKGGAKVEDIEVTLSTASTTQVYALNHDGREGSIRLNLNENNQADITVDDRFNTVVTRNDKTGEATTDENRMVTLTVSFTLNIGGIDSEFSSSIKLRSYAGI